VTLEANGDLDIKKIGVGKPKDQFVVRIIPVLVTILSPVDCGTRQYMMENSFSLELTNQHLH